MEDPGSRLRAFFDELFGSYINIFLLIFCVFLLFKILRKSLFESVEEMLPRPPAIPPMKKRDMTLDELKQFNGETVCEDGENRILIAVNHNLIDVTRGRGLYGPGAPYHMYAGKDASRGLATFSVNAEVIRETYDDLSDLSPSELDALREWESQLCGKYDVVGRLLAPGETPAKYDGDENGEDASGEDASGEDVSGEDEAICGEDASGEDAEGEARLKSS